MSPIPNHRKFRIALLTLWAVVITATVCLFLFQREAVQRELHDAMSASMLTACGIYLLLGCLRGFTLIPATSLVLVGVAFFPPVTLFILTLIGNLVFVLKVSSYWQPVASGVILLLSVLASSIAEKAARGRAA